MKNRTDKFLLAVFLLSFMLHVLIVLTYLEIIPFNRPLWLYSVHAWLAVGFSFCPAFCLQLLLCRKTRRWVAALPALAIIGAALWFACGWLTSMGWDSLGWAILFWLSIAPAAGCVLAWTAFGLCTLYRKGALR